MSTQTSETGHPMSRTEIADLLLDALRSMRLALAGTPGSGDLDASLRSTIDRAPAVGILRARLREAAKWASSHYDAAADRAGLIGAVDAARHALHVTRQPLRCPDCGGQITANLGREGGSAYLSYEVVESYECDDYTCGAEWDTSGASSSSPYSGGC